MVQTVQNVMFIYVFFPFSLKISVTDKYSGYQNFTTYFMLEYKTLIHDG